MAAFWDDVGASLLGQTDTAGTDGGAADVFEEELSDDAFPGLFAKEPARPCTTTTRNPGTLAATAAKASKGRRKQGREQREEERRTAACTAAAAEGRELATAAGRSATADFGQPGGALARTRERLLQRLRGEPTGGHL